MKSPVFRDVLGDVYGSREGINPISPEWRSEAIVALVSGRYAERAFDRLPVLADALQDAGCEDEKVLTHCWEPGPQMRGCWVTDACLSKS